jgi:transcriptional regulator with XRE-family HTH domain
VVLEREFNTRYWGRSVTLQAVRRWLRGEAIPSQEKLQVLADWLKVEPHYLRFGDQVLKSLKAQQKRWDEGIGYVERETFDAFLQLPTPQRKIVRSWRLQKRARWRLRVAELGHRPALLLQMWRLRPKISGRTTTASLGCMEWAGWLSAGKHRMLWD